MVEQSRQRGQVCELFVPIAIPCSVHSFIDGGTGIWTMKDSCSETTQGQCRRRKAEDVQVGTQRSGMGEDGDEFTTLWNRRASLHLKPLSTEDLTRVRK